MELYRTKQFAAMSKYLPITETEQKIWSVLCEYMNVKTNQCFPKLATIAEKVGVSTKTITRATNRFMQLGLIVKSKRYIEKAASAATGWIKEKHRTSNLYHFQVANIKMMYADYWFKKGKPSSRVLFSLANDGDDTLKKEVSKRNFENQRKINALPMSVRVVPAKPDNYYSNNKRPNKAERKAVPAVGVDFEYGSRTQEHTEIGNKNLKSIRNMFFKKIGDVVLCK